MPKKKHIENLDLNNLDSTNVMFKKLLAHPEISAMDCKSVGTKISNDSSEITWESINDMIMNSISNPLFSETIKKNETITQEDPNLNVSEKQKKLKYDTFCEKVLFNNLVTNLQLRKLLRQKITMFNKKQFIVYYLFNLFVYDTLEDYDKYMNYFGCSLDAINKVTIQRCSTIFNGTTFKKKDNEGKLIRDHYAKYKYLFDMVINPKIKSDNQPIESFSVQMITNIQNHFTINFDKFQLRYLRPKLEIHLQCYFMSIDNIPRRLLNYLAKRCMAAINSNDKILINLDPERKENANIDRELLSKALNKFVLYEKRFIPIKLQGKLHATTENTIDSRNKLILNDLWGMLGYYRVMVKSLENMSLKSFDILPQLNLGMHFVRFGSKYLSCVYNELNKLTGKSKINIKTFEENYEYYYKEMFNLDYFGNRRDLQGLIPVSFITDGISISCMFRTEKIPKSKASTQESEIITDKEETALEETALEEYEVITDEEETALEEYEVITDEEETTLEGHEIITDEEEIALEEYEIISNESETPIEGYDIISNKGETILEESGIISDNTHITKKSKIVHEKYNIGETIMEGVYEAIDLKCSEEELKKYDIRAADVGVQDIVHVTSKNGFTKIITRNQYYHESHINRNKKKSEELIKKNCKEVFEELTECPHKTANIKKYIKYILMIFKNWDKIWKMNETLKANKLKYDTCMNKKRAMKHILRSLVRRRQIQRNRKGKPGKKEKSMTNSNGKVSWPEFNNSDTNKKYFDQEAYNEQKDLPKLFAYGKGNGNTTVSNVRGSGPKGPVKELAKQLGKRSLVALTNEYNSSQYTKCHKSKIEHPITKHYKSKKKNDGKIDEVGENRKSYRMCCCTNSKCHKIWNRDQTASFSIGETCENTIIGKDLGPFQPKKKENIKSESRASINNKTQMPNKDVKLKGVRNPNKRTSNRGKIRETLIGTQS